jgi:exopolysaccharide production protein ExoZ
MLFYVLAAVVTPWFGIYGVAAVLALGVAADHATELPWYLHQYFFYYGNFLAGIAAFLVHRSGLRLGFILPLVLGFVAFHWAPTRSLFPIALFCWLVGFVNLNIIWRIGRLGALLGDASYSIYLLHPLVFYWIYIQLQPPLPPVWMQEPLRYGAMIAVCGAAITSWMLFERPMIYLGGRVDRYFRSRGSTTVLADQTSG